MGLVKDIKAVFEKKKEVYKISSDEMLGDYKREQEAIGGYNGRQIFELIQNCDDEEADLVHIKLNQTSQTITISNTGRPFSLQGYRSLSIANLSSKSSKLRYIGNKGLGFRSIVNWSKDIKVYSNNICLEFSNASKQATFSELFDSEKQNKLRDQIGVLESVIPIPFLASPVVTEVEQTTGFTTSIEIEYLPVFYEDIIKQLKSITPEILLFLKHITAIKIDGVPGLGNLSCTKNKHPEYQEGSFSPKEIITINNNSWSIFTKEEDLDIESEGQKEKAFYELKVAVKDDLSDQSSFLFSHFPTKIKLDFPYIIHGTFDLDQNRNHINDSIKNKIVLEKLVSLLIDTARYLSQKEVNWNPYKILSIKNTSDDRLRELGFYSALEKAIQQERIFPCVDGQYRALSEVYFVSDAFSSLVIQNSWSNKLPQLLLPKGAIEFGFLNIKTQYPDLENIIDEISGSIRDIILRANFIKELNTIYSEEKFSLLVNENNELIDKNTDAYTPTPKESKIKIPSYCNIEIINEQLFTSLVNCLSISESTEKARDFQRKLKGNFKVHSYEPTPLIQKIISNTLDELESTTGDQNKVNVIKEMVLCVYHNYKIRKNKNTTLDVAKIPLLNSHLQIVNADELFLSKEFQIGKIAADIFEKVPIERDVLARIQEYGLEDESIEEIEGFFIWLGVKKFATYSEFEEKKGQDAIVKEFCIKHNHRGIKAVEVNYYSVNNIRTIISEIEVESFLLWYDQDKILKKCIDQKTHQDTYRRYNHQYYNKANFSFSYFLVSKLLIDFESHLLDENLHWLNTDRINYKHELFEKYNYTKRDVDNILVGLGAKDEFEDLSIEYVTFCLEKIAKLFPTGHKSQLLYKKAVHHFELHQQSLTRKVQLFANDGNERKLFNPEQIYFSDKVKIPDKLKESYPILNFPLRAGGAKAIEFFHINDASKLRFEIGDLSTHTGATEALMAFFNDVKIYLLVQRFEYLTKSSVKKDDAAILHKINIHLVHELSYKINDQLIDTELYEFIPQEAHNYYVKVDKNDTLNSLKKNNKFSDSFAEIICHAFDSTKGKSEFRTTFRNDLVDTEYTIRHHHGEEILLEAYDIFGKSEFDLDLWFELSEIANTSLKSESEIKSFLANNQETLGNQAKNLRKISDRTLFREEKIELLLQLLEITIEQFNSETSYKIDSFTYHLDRLKVHFEKEANKVFSALWHYLNKNSQLQDQFLDRIDIYNSNKNYIEEKANENRWLSEINVEECFVDFFSNSFPNVAFNEPYVNINSLETENNKQFTQQELDIITQSKKLRSLRYFSNQIEAIKKEIRKQTEIDETEINFSTSQNENKYILKEPVKFSVQSRGINRSNKKGVFIPRAGKSEQEKKKVGDNAESIVYGKLVEMYGEENVTHVAKLNEGLHYDIRYLFPDSGIMKYVEVKSMAANSFYLSYDEKKFGEAHKENYEIWVVQNCSIIPLRGFFLDETHQLVPKEYIVTPHLEF